jgi:hypothetical protein
MKVTIEIKIERREGYNDHTVAAEKREFEIQTNDEREVARKVTRITDEVTLSIERQLDDIRALREEHESEGAEL